jgi:hypothetical protein
VIVEDAGVAPGDVRALVEQPGVAGVWTFATNPDLTSRRWSAGARRITVAWLDEEPLAVAPPPMHDAGVVFAGPLETITPWQWTWFD